ncbi:hypothetical protein KC992_01295 [Candidatus Saccharibacteria bacterium]|nr:hypothetical protein [Candidatus Saccharibacteria bacterium]MCA9328305.1 hypothetical protein [Candidatus Saccharibacteria bacterium]
MSSEKKSLVFFGSGPVAAASLAKLRDSFLIEAIITKATTEQEMRTACPDAPIYLVSTKSDVDLITAEHSFQSKLGVLIDFGIIVSQKVIDSFPKGIVNSHFSLLPELRGADPISFAILEGHEKTGVSLMLLVEAMDEGPLLAAHEVSLNGSETTPELTDTLINVSYELLRKNLPLYLSGDLEAQNQSGTASYTRKLTKADGKIDWSKPATQIEREIRAYTGWPKSTAHLGEIECVVLAAKVVPNQGASGTLFIQEKQLGVNCGHAALLLSQLKPAGKKAMDSQAFLAGYRNKLGL